MLTGIIKIKKSDSKSLIKNTKCWRACKGSGMFTRASLDYTLMWALWKKVWHYVVKFYMWKSQDPGIPLQDIYSRVTVPYMYHFINIFLSSCNTILSKRSKSQEHTYIKTTRFRLLKSSKPGNVKQYSMLFRDAFS